MQTREQLQLSKLAASGMEPEKLQEFPGEIDEQRREFFKLVGGGAGALALRGTLATAGATIAAFQAPDAHAWLGFVLRLLLRAGVRGAARGGMRGSRALARSWRRGGTTRRAYSGTSGLSRGSVVNKVADGYYAVDLLSSMMDVPPGVLAVPEELAQQAIEHEAETLWIKDDLNRLRTAYWNDTEYTIPAPVVEFLQQNLETGAQSVRNNPLIFGHDWLPGEQGAVPAQGAPDSEALPIRIAETGPISIEPFIEAEPWAQLDPTVVMVVEARHVQYRRG